MGKATIAGILIGLLAGLAIGYLVLPLLIPLQADDQSGKIIQTEFTTWKTEAFISDANTTPTIIPDTSEIVTTGGNSYLVI